MLATRHNIFNPFTRILLSVALKLGFSARTMSEYLYSLIETEDIEVSITVENRVLEIKYVGNKFGLDDLAKTKTKNRVYGNGYKVLIGNKDIEYKYENGYNIYYINIDVESNYTETVVLSGNVDKAGGDAVFKILTSISETAIYSEWSQYVIEIVGNIAHYVNIKSKHINIIRMYLEVIKIGIQAHKR